MKSFQTLLEEDTVQKRTPNPEQARSVFQKGEKPYNYAQEKPLTEANADLVLEDMYEAMRELIDGFLIFQGYKTYSHEAAIAYAADELALSQDEANRLNKYRKLRNDSKYRGEDVTKKEAADCTALAETLLPRLRQQFNTLQQKEESE